MPFFLIFFYNTITHCFSGAAAYEILVKLQDLIQMLQTSITSHSSCRNKQYCTDWVDHIRFYPSSKLLKTVRAALAVLVDFIVYIPGYSLTVGSIMWFLKLIIIPNLFSKHWLYFNTDGLHLNRLGRGMLIANMQHTDCFHPPLDALLLIWSNA